MAEFRIKGTAEVSYSWESDCEVNGTIGHDGLDVNEQGLRDLEEGLIQAGSGSQEVEIDTTIEADSVSDLKRMLDKFSDARSWDISCEVGHNQEKLVSMSADEVELNVTAYEIRDELTEDETRLLNQAKEQVEKLNALCAPFTDIINLLKIPTIEVHADQEPTQNIPPASPQITAGIQSLRTLQDLTGRLKGMLGEFERLMKEKEVNLD
jgi:hypothetical protein